MQNKILAKKMSLQLKSTQQMRKLETGKEIRIKSKEFRQKSARIIPSTHYVSLPNKNCNEFTPWDAEIESATLIN